MLWLVLLPFRLLFAVVFGILALPFALVLLPFALLLWLPFLLLKFTLRVAAALLLVPLLVLGGVIGLLVAGIAAVAMMVPLLPIAIVLLLVWALRRPPRSGERFRLPA
jgi:hypothetical protein